MVHHGKVLWNPLNCTLIQPGSPASIVLSYNIILSKKSAAFGMKLKSCHAPLANLAC
jgi:hypothetical protein